MRLSAGHGSPNTHAGHGARFGRTTRTSRAARLRRRRADRAQLVLTTTAVVVFVAVAGPLWVNSPPLALAAAGGMAAALAALAIAAARIPDSDRRQADRWAAAVRELRAWADRSVAQTCSEPFVPPPRPKAVNPVRRGRRGFGRSEQGHRGLGQHWR
jgi:hypothetical protein